MSKNKLKYSNNRKICDDTNDTILIVSSDSDNISNFFFTEYITLLTCEQHNFYRFLKQNYIYEIYGNLLTTNDMERLLPNKWLNDKIINTYFDLLKSKFPNYYFVSTFFISSLLKNRRQHDIINKELLSKWEQSNGCIIPVHLGIHWCLFYFNIPILYVFDSLGTIDYLKVYLFKTILEKISNISIVIKPLTTLKTNIPLQTNGNDCGVFICMYAKGIVLNNRFYKGNMDIYRKRIFHELLAKKIIYGNDESYELFLNPLE